MKIYRDNPYDDKCGFMSFLFTFFWVYTRHFFDF
jgi:hypothetical protein